MNKRFNFFSLISLLTVVALLLGACVTPAPAPAPAAAPTAAPAATQAPAPEAKVYKIAFSIPGLNFPFFVHMERSIKAAAAEMGNVEIITLDGQDKTEKQVADLESVITQKLDGLIVSPRTTEGVGEAIQAVIDAGIPVVTVDRRAENVKGLLAHVGAENVLGGEAQGQALVGLFPKGATIFELLGTPGASPAIDRSKGLHNVIDKAGNFKIPCQQTGEFNRDKGLSVTESCLGATPDPAAIVAANDDMALGAVEAAKAAGLKVPIIGYDALPEALKSINAGELYGSVEQFPGKQVATSLSTVMDFITKGTKPDKDVIFITPKMITKENLSEAERLGETDITAAPAEPGKVYKIAFSIPGLNFPFFVHMDRSIKAAAEKMGNVEIITLDGQDKTEKQVADLESVVTQGLDGLIVSPRTTEGVGEAIQAVIDAGIPVVTVDRRAENVKGLLAHVGAENVLGGEAQGQALTSLFPDGATIFELLGTPGASPAIDRSKGLHNVIDKAGNFKIPCQQTGEFNRDKGLSVTESCLGATPDPAAIVAANDDMALGAVEAAKAAGLSVPIIGYDALPEALKSINAGELYGSVEQFPGKQVATSLSTVMDFITKGTKPDKDVIFITPKMITKDNLSEAERLGETDITAAPAAAGKVYKIAFSIPGLNFPFFVHMERSIKAAAEKMGNVEIITLDGQDNTEKQVADLEAVVTQKLDGLIVSPRTTQGVGEAIQAVIDAGIPVVTVDRRADNVTGLLAHVGAENVLGGEAQGQTLVGLFPKGATIFELLGTPGASPAIDRSKGLHNVIDPAGNFTIPCQQTGNFNRADGLKVTESCLGATPDPAAIVAANDDMALGAVEAAKAAGLSVRIVGYDALPEALKSIQAGELYGSVEQFPGQQVATSLQTVMDFITKGAKPDKDVIFITPKMITKDNINEAERLGEIQ